MKNTLKQVAAAAFATLGLIGAASAENSLSQENAKFCRQFDNAHFIGINGENDKLIVAANGYFAKNGHALITQASKDPCAEPLKTIATEMCANPEAAFEKINSQPARAGRRTVTHADINEFCSAPKIK
ncbi:hypothetical protein [Caballeronia sp. AZ7_KS35]|uniref:hypothetical protein n=1 Tax=Caballeronia sp. AZ7_KS35 TaxID=2921762 RepID=UPI00202972FC|nr:hypothetical protein [Caballeronia sp. AZ7_KS35]